MESKIKLLQYKKIGTKGDFFEVFATTDADKISFEGRMCGGLLKKFIKEVKEQGGKIERSTTKVIEREQFEENKRLKKELKDCCSTLSKIIKLATDELER